MSCAWEATPSDESWITINSDRVGIGNAKLSFTIGANEQIVWKQRFFVPTKHERGKAIITALLEQFPVIADEHEHEDSDLQSDVISTPFKKRLTHGLGRSKVGFLKLKIDFNFI